MTPEPGNRPGNEEMKEYFEGGKSGSNWREKQRGENVVTQAGYIYRNAERAFGALTAMPEGRDWNGGLANVALPAILVDSGVRTKFREIDATLSWATSTGQALLWKDAVDACNELHGLEPGYGIQLMGGYQTGLVKKEVAEEKEKKMKEGALEALDEAGIEEVDDQTLGIVSNASMRVVMEGMNVAVLGDRLDGYLLNLLLARESHDTVSVRGIDNRKELKRRLREKRRELTKVEQAVVGLGLSVSWLHDLVKMESDIGGIVKIFTNPHSMEIPTHLLRFLSLSDDLNVAVTSASRMLCQLECPPDTEVIGTEKVLKEGKEVEEEIMGPKHDSPLFTKKGHVLSLAAGKYTPAERDKFLEDWEDLVVEELGEETGNSLQLAELGVSLAMFLSEITKLGSNSVLRDRRTGEKLDIKIEKAEDLYVEVKGNGSLYDFGGSDMSEKAFELRKRKMGEIEKGRKGPRPGVAYALKEKLTANLLEYTQAVVVRGGKKTYLEMSALEALITGNVAGGAEYTMADFIDNMQNQQHFLAMLFAFRAAQIQDKLDNLIAGRIDVIKELGGGPERLIQEMSELIIGLNKAWQQTPYGSKEHPPYLAMTDEEDPSLSDEGKKRVEAAKAAKGIEGKRNMVNLLADFVRGAKRSAVSAGGYLENPEIRGVWDKLPSIMYERLCLYNNVFTSQQFWLMMRMVEDDDAEGILTEERVWKEDEVGEDKVSGTLRKILGQDPKEDPESLVKMMTEGRGWSGGGVESDKNKVWKEIINNSSKDVGKYKKGRKIPDYARFGNYMQDAV